MGFAFLFVILACAAFGLAGYAQTVHHVTDWFDLGLGAFFLLVAVVVVWAEGLLPKGR